MADKDFVVKNGLIVGDTVTINGVQIDPSGASSNQVLKFDGTKFAPAADSTIDEPSSYSETVGNGSSSSYTLTHNLNTRDVVVSVRDAASPYDYINVRSESTSANTVTLDFSSNVSSNSRDVLIISAGDLDYYTSTIGDGSNSSIVLNHNLGSRDVVATVRNASSPYEFIDVATFATSPNKVTLDFSSAPLANTLVASVYLPLEGYSYSEVIGDDSNSAFTLTHNLNTRNINVIARETDSPYEIIKIYWKATTLDTASIFFSNAPSSNSIQVTVFAGLGGKVSIPSFTQIYDKSFDYKIGDTGPGGGTIFYVDVYNEWPDFTYLEVSPLSLQEMKTWISSNEDISAQAVAGADGVNIGDGEQNTIDILSQAEAIDGGSHINTQNSAAKYCYNLTYNGYSDWFLPSINELRELKAQRSFVDTSLTSGYWSSTEDLSFSPPRAYGSNLSSFPVTSLLQNLKWAEMKVRPVRSFTGGNYSVGDTGPAGGKIFITPETTNANNWSNNTGKYFEVAPLSTEVTITWAPKSLNLPGSYIKKLGGGHQNTLDIISSGLAESDTSAARYCYNLVYNNKSDWYLPSIGELKKIYDILYIEKEIESFSTDYSYWSSTEISAGQTQTFSFVTGTIGADYASRTDTSRYARPVRRFS